SFNWPYKRPKLSRSPAARAASACAASCCARRHRAASAGSAGARASPPEENRLRSSAAVLLPWPRCSPQERNTVSMPVGGPPAVDWLNSACSKKRARATFQRRGTPGAVVLGDPTSTGGRGGAGLGRHTDSRGPPGAIVADTSATNVLPASHAWPIQTPGAAVVPSAVGATTSSGPLAR